MIKEGKVCTQCNEWKPYGEYYRRMSNKDGRYSWCKLCDKEKKRQYYQENAEQIKAKTSAYQKTARGREVSRKAKRKYYQNPEKRAIHLRYGRQYVRLEKRKKAQVDYRKRNPEKKKAQQVLNYAVRKGLFPKLREVVIPCEIQSPRCTGRAHDRHHHLGYAPEHWYDFQCVCRTCHKFLHQESLVQLSSTPNTRISLL